MEKKIKTPQQIRNEVEKEMEKQKIRDYLWNLNCGKFWIIAEKRWYKLHPSFWYNVFHDDDRFIWIKTEQTRLFELEFCEVLK